MEMNKDYIRKYYSDLNTLIKMSQYARFREVAFLSRSKKFPNIRYLRGGYPKNWEGLFHHTKFFNTDYSIYITTCFYDTYPFFSFFGNRKEEITEWKKEELKHLKGQDFLLDIDVKSDSRKDKNICDLIQKVKEYHRGLKDETKFPYQLRYSGRGLHLIIPYHYFKSLGHTLNPHENNNLYDFYMELSIDFKHSLGIKDIDLSVNTCGRLHKLPFSLANYDGDCRIVEVLSTNMHKRENCNRFLEVIRNG